MEGGGVLFYENLDKTPLMPAFHYLLDLSHGVCTIFSCHVAVFDIISKPCFIHPSSSLSLHLVLEIVKIKIDAIHPLMKST